MSAIVCALALLGLQASPKVSLTLPATSMVRIVKRLSEMTSTKVIVDKEFAGTPLIVVAKDVELRDLLGKMATALEADVQPEDGGFRIVRTAAHRSRLLEARRKEREAEWVDLLKVHRDQYRKNPWSTEFAEKLVAEEEKAFAAYMKEYGSARLYEASQENAISINFQKPATRLLFRILQAIGPGELSRLPEYARTVYAADPKPLQKAIPGIDGLLRLYLAESRLNPAPQQREGEEGALDDILNLPRIAAPPGRVLVTVPGASIRDILFGPRPFAKLQVYDAAGKLVESALLEEIPTDEPENEELAKRFAKLAPFLASPLAMELVRLNMRAPKRGEETQEESAHGDDKVQDFAPRESPELIQRLLQPEEFDPLSLMPSEVLIEYAAQTRQNVVAQLSDEDVLDYIDDFIERDGRVSMSIMEWLVDPDEMSEAPSPGWLVLRPRDILNEEIKRFPRSTIGRYARSAAAKGPTLDAMLDAYRSYKAPHLATLRVWMRPVANYLSGIDSELSLDFGGDYSCRFLASLDTTRRSLLLRGGELVAADLSSEQRGWLDGVAYAQDSLDLDGDSEEEGCDDPTEVLPGGIPTGTRISYSAESVEHFYTWGATSPVKALAAAHLLATKYPDDPDSQFAREYPKHWIYPYTVVTHRLTFAFDKQRSLTRSFEITRPRRFYKPLRLDSPEMMAKLKPWLSKFKNADRQELMDVIFGG